MKLGSSARAARGARPSPRHSPSTTAAGGPEMGDQIGLGRVEVMCEVVGLDARQAQGYPILAEGRDRVWARQQRRAGALVNAPGARRRHVNAGIGVDEPPIVVPQQIA